MSLLRAIKFLSEVGVPYGIKQIDNKIRTSCNPFTYDVAQEKVTGANFLTGFGERTSIAVEAKGEDLWYGTAARIPYPPDVGEQMTLVSTSVEDGAGTETGILTVCIHYIDADGNEQKETDLIMNGTTSVDTIATNIRWVQHIHAKTVGSNGVAAGTITMHKKGDTITVYDMIKVGGNMSLSTDRMVPVGKTLWITSWRATATSGKPMALRLRATSENGNTFPGVFLFKDSCFLHDSPYSHIFEHPIRVSSLAVVKVSVWATQALGSASASWEGFMEDNP